MTRLLAGSAGGGGSVGGAANMAAAWCWCWACERSAKCEVDRWGPGPRGDRDACFASPRLALLPAPLLLLRGAGLSAWGRGVRAAPPPSRAGPSPPHLRLCGPLCAAWPWPAKAPRGRGTCVGSGARGCGGAGGGCGVRRGRAGASFLTGGLAGAPGAGSAGGAGLRTVGRKGGSALNSRLRSRPETLGGAPALASASSPSVGPAERGPE